MILKEAETVFGLKQAVVQMGFQGVLSLLVSVLAFLRFFYLVHVTTLKHVRAVEVGFKATCLVRSMKMVRSSKRMSWQHHFSCPVEAFVGMKTVYCVELHAPATYPCENEAARAWWRNAEFLKIVEFWGVV